MQRLTRNLDRGMHPVYKLRWEPEKGAHEAGLYHAQVLVQGKWRTMYVACRAPRKFKAKELKAIQKTIWLNTGKTVAQEDISFDVVE